MEFMIIECMQSSYLVDELDVITSLCYDGLLS